MLTHSHAKPKMRRQQFINAVSIKTRGLLFSSAIKASLILLLIVSTAMAFWPFFSNLLFPPTTLSIYVDPSASSVANNYSEIASRVDRQKEADFILSFDSKTQNYLITLQSQAASKRQQELLAPLLSQNQAKLLASVPEDYQTLITGENISIEDCSDNKGISEEHFLFLMSIVLMYFIMSLILISRIAAQVAYEKGTCVTDVILASLSRERLFAAEALSACLVVTIHIAAISIPFIIASFIRDESIVSKFVFLNSTTILLLFIHLCLSCYVMVIPCIGLCSLSREPEDSNLFALIFMIPMLVSYLYTIMNFSLFNGWATFLNYTPIFSIYPIVIHLITGRAGGDICLFLFSELTFLAILSIFSKRLFIKNITVR